jgi:hypothetical protein
MTEECDHGWMYDDKMLLCNPPIQNRICRKCLKVEAYQAPTFSETETFQGLLRKKMQEKLLREDND